MLLSIHFTTEMKIKIGILSRLLAIKQNSQCTGCLKDLGTFTIQKVRHVIIRDNSSVKLQTLAIKSTREVSLLEKF